MTSMFYITISLLVIAIVLVINELWWRNKASHAEHHRKFVHITVGTFVAFWPYYLSWTEIRLLSLVLLVAIAASKTLKIFASIHAVDRATVGEICFALAVGGLTFVTRSDWIYTASLLQMSLADGLAAIVGIHFRRNNGYKVLGAQKSVAGTLSFFIISLSILIIARLVSGTVFELWLVLVTSLAATLSESIASYGLDNLLLPMVSAFMLTRL